jgi:hypothetical protein
VHFLPVSDSHSVSAIIPQSDVIPFGAAMDRFVSVLANFSLYLGKLPLIRAKESKSPQEGGGHDYTCYPLMRRLWKKNDILGCPSSNQTAKKTFVLHTQVILFFFCELCLSSWYVLIPVSIRCSFLAQVTSSRPLHHRTAPAPPEQTPFLLGGPPCSMPH